MFLFNYKLHDQCERCSCSIWVFADRVVWDAGQCLKTNKNKRGDAASFSRGRARKRLAWMLEKQR